MNPNFDVVVIGAGPCGSFSALTLKKLGVEGVVVFEEHSEVGVPQHCAGHISIRGLKRLGLHPPKKIVENEIRGVVFHSPSGRRFVVRRDQPVSVVVNRELFDKYVAELAVRAGAELRLGVKVKSLNVKGNAVEGVVVQGGAGRKLVGSSIVVDAEGCSSSLLRKAGLPTLDPSMVVYGAQADVEDVCDVERDMVEVYLGRSYAPNFFAWIIPKRDGSAKVGLGTSRGNPRRFLTRFMKKHPIASQKMRRSKVARVAFHPITLGGPISETYGDGILVVGDAASQVKPTTGGGVVFGMLCARIACKVACEALAKEDFSGTLLSRYQARWKREIGFELAAMLRLRRMLNRLSDKKIDKLLELCSNLELNTALEKVGDVDLQGRTLLRLIQKPKGFLSVLYLGLSSFFSKPATHQKELN